MSFGSGERSNAVAASSGQVRLNVVGDYDGKIDAPATSLWRDLRTTRIPASQGRCRRQPSRAVVRAARVLLADNRQQTARRHSVGQVQSFRVSCNELTEVDLLVRPDKELDQEQASQLGSIPQGIVVTALDGSTSRLDDFVARAGAVLAWIEPDREPSKHLIRELGELREEFARTGAGIYLFVGEEHSTVSLGGNGYRELPKSAQLSLDRNGECLKAVKAGLAEKAGFAEKAGLSGPAQQSLPFVLVVGPDRVIRYVSAGYRLGVGMDVLRKLR